MLHGQTVLHLLTLLPRGNIADSLPLAAELAVDKINARDDLLPGYRLELIAADVTKKLDLTVEMQRFLTRKLL